MFIVSDYLPLRHAQMSDLAAPLAAEPLFKLSTLCPR